MEGGRYVEGGEAVVYRNVSHDRLGVINTDTSTCTEPRPPLCCTDVNIFTAMGQIGTVGPPLTKILLQTNVT